MKKIFVILLVFVVGFSVFAEATGNALLDEALQMVAVKALQIMQKREWFIAGAVCLFIEFVLKKLINDKTKAKWFWRLSPLILCVLIELVITFINKGVWYEGLLLGVQVGAIATTYYNAIIEPVKKSFTAGVGGIAEATKKAVEDKK